MSFRGAAAAAAAGLGGRGGGVEGGEVGLSPFLQDQELSPRERQKRALGGESGWIPPPSSFLFHSSPPLPSFVLHSRSL